ncbi:hypothetical protein [Methylibium sp.]|uniref:hypothetical protein n=1 Tax=Methylibium sp. TaxID=2067992 RepID=UPI003340CC41
MTTQADNPAATPATPAASDTPATPAAPATGGAFGAFADTPAAPAAPATPPADAPKPIAERIPEKYQVKAADGTLDMDASLAKVLDGYTHLEKRMGTGDAPPKTPDDYAPQVEGFDIAQLKEDPKYQGFLKGAHAKGLTNAQVSWILGEYAERAGDGATAAAGMSVDEFREAVTPHFDALGGYEKGMASAMNAIRAVVPDVTAAELASLPNSPLVARVLAKLGAEIGEDRRVNPGQLAVADWEGEVAKLRASEAYNKANHPEHTIALKRMDELYAQRYGKQARALGASVVVNT